LRGWLESGNSAAAFWTSADPPTRRRFGDVVLPGWSVRRLLKSHDIPPVTVPRLRNWAEAEAEVRALGVDTLITCVTMMIVPPRQLDMFGGRAVNLHPSLLPAYRGPSPFLGALLDGNENTQSGVTAHVLSPGIDEGPIIAQSALPFEAAGRNYQVWLAQHAAACRELAREALPAYLEGRLEARPQVGGFYRKVSDEGEIGPHMTLADAERTLGVAGDTRRIVVLLASRRRPVSVRRVHRVLGPATGEPPVLKTLTVTLDLSDARVVLARNTAVERNLDRLTVVRTLRRFDQE
jgi:methionyl-tRNA formyltransferase